MAVGILLRQGWGVGILSSSEQAAKAKAAKANSKSFFIFRLFYVHKIKKSGSELPESNPPFHATGRAPINKAALLQQTPTLPCLRPKRSVLRRACPKIRILPPGDARQVFWLVPAATPSQSKDQWLKECCGNRRNIQQRELLPNYTAFPFNHTGPCPALCEPLRCKVKK